MATVIRLTKRNHRIKVQHIRPTVRLKHLKRKISVHHTGRPGLPGAPGEQGPAGIGIPSGGATGDILVKAGSNDFETTWASPIDIGDKHYTASFTTANSVVVYHNLGKQPAISVIDSAGEEVEAMVEYETLNQVRLTFTYPFSGIVTCN